jgi:uncharacterized protein (TIGR02246 family)
MKISALRLAIGWWLWLGVALVLAEPPPPPPPAPTASAAAATIGKWFKAYAARDAEAMLALVAPDERAVFISAEATLIGAAALRENLVRHLQECEQIVVTPARISVGAKGEFAYAFAPVAVDITRAGKPEHHELRFTAVLEWRDAQWLIVQMHNSVPIAKPVEAGE